MIAIMFAVAVIESQSEAPAHAPNPVQLVDTTSRLSIPQPIFWEVQPYLNCLMEQSNLQLKAMGGATEEKFPAIKVVAIAACQGQRVTTKATAIKALRKSDIRRSERSDYVERALVSIEDQSLAAPHAPGISE